MSDSTPTTAQPTLNQAYTTPGNPATHKPSEASSSTQQSPLNADPQLTRRTPHDQQNAEPTPSALARGPGAKADRPEGEVEDADPLDGEQMRAPGKGEVMAAQWHKTGFGEQESLTEGLEAKKEEQRGKREKVKGERRRGGDVDGGMQGGVDPGV